jgi:hypothetical protein
MITVAEKGSPATTVVAPNLERIGYGNESIPGDGSGLSIIGLTDETSNLTTISFPVLTSTGGAFVWVVNPLITNVTGFPVLATVGDVLFGPLTITGDFTSVAFPALTSVREGIVIESTGSSFRCPFNITPKIVGSGYCVSCQYLPNTNELPSSTCNSGPTQTAVKPTASLTTTAGTNPTETGKASGASTLILRVINLIR